MYERTSKKQIILTSTPPLTTTTTIAAETPNNKQKCCNPKLLQQNRQLKRTTQRTQKVAITTPPQQQQQEQKVKQRLNNKRCVTKSVALQKEHLNANRISSSSSSNHPTNTTNNMFELEQQQHYQQQPNIHYSAGATNSANYIPNIATLSADAHDDSNATTVLSLSSSPCSSTDSYDSTLSNSPNSSNSSNCSHNSNSSNASTTGTSSSSTPIGVNLRVTGQCSQGGRKYMEDYFSVAYQQSENAKDLEYAFIGIYDGHGGAEAAIFAKEHLMMEIIRQKQFWSDNDHDVLRAIREGYIATHYAMWRDQENWPKTANGLPSTAGTTATIAFIRREKIYIGHVGDSGIVLGYQNEFEDQWRAKALTTDHKPESVPERTRIKRAGGKVMVKSGVPRVVWRRPRNPTHVGPIRSTTPVDEIPFLAVARSLGDLWSYNPENREFVVSPDPDVKVVKINPKTFRCLIFGTDGLWNVITPQEAVDKVHERELVNQRLQNLHYDSNYDNNEMHWTNPSKGLVEDALKTWSAKKMRADNTSVVTVILYPATEQTKYERNAMPTPEMTPMSYGLEYTKMQADLPVYEDNITYKELAQKYLPPEAYRNYDYYDNEEAGFINHHNNSDMQVLIEEVAAHEVYPGHINIATTVAKPAAEEPLESDSDEEDEDVEDEEDDEDDADNEENPVCSEESSAVVEAIAIDEHDNTIANSDNIEIEVPEVFYPARSQPTSFEDWDPAVHVYSEDATRCYDEVDHSEPSAEHNHSETNEDNLGKYADIGISFAETFNSLLAEHEVTQPQQTNTVQTTTTTYASMQEILQEQACMSEQEGYSLTKLETRQEKQQQQNKKVQSATLLNETAERVERAVGDESTLETINGVTQTSCYWATTRFQLPQIENLSEKQQKLLELNSLLQQEHEEEQQVLLERLQMAREQLSDVTKVTHQQVEENVEENYQITQQSMEKSKEDVTLALQQNARVVGDAEVVLTAAEATPQMTEAKEGWCDTSSMDEPIIEEYLEDTLPAVQINEISSSNITETMLPVEAEEDKLSDITLCSSSNCLIDSETAATVSNMSCTTEVIELLEKVEIFQPIVDIVDINDKYKLITATGIEPIDNKSGTNDERNSRLTLKRSLSKMQCYPTTSSPQKRPRTRSLYPNIPNENQRHSLTTSTHSMRHLRSPAAAVTFSNNAAAAAYTLLKNDKRQLRSTTNMQLANGGSSCSNGIDYSKRTLRTRNTLTKDLKAKSTYATTTTHAPKHTAPSGVNNLNKQFIRQNATAILNAAEVNRRATSRTRPIPANASPAVGGSAHSYGVSRKPAVLNLRSRQADASKNVPSAATLNQRGNRNLRSTTAPTTQRHTLASALSTITTIKITPTSYSKTTKLQQSGNGAIAVAPPPSPKLINGTTASTRARSMMAAKATQTMRTATAPLGKGVTLRSQSTSQISARIAEPQKHSNCDSSRSSTLSSNRGRLQRKR